MERSRWIAWILIVLVIALVPIAWASPPDPTWIKGVYDDADFDDIIILITSGSVAVHAPCVVNASPALPLVPAVLAPKDGCGLPVPFSPQAPRAPPLS